MTIVFCASFVAAGAWALNRTGATEWIDAAYTDTWLQIEGVRKTPEHVVIVTIDDQSYQQFASDPLAFWSPHIAKAIATLRQAKVAVVGVDILFASSPAAWMQRFLGAESEAARRYNASFQQEIQAGGVVLPALRYTGFREVYDSLLLPDQDYLLALPGLDFTNHLGLANLDDRDNVIRRMDIAPALNLKPGGGTTDQANVPKLSFAALLAIKATQQDARKSSWTLPSKTGAGMPSAGLVNANDQSRWIAFAGPPGTVRRISFGSLLKEGAATDPQIRSLAGKVVILAYEDGSDRHITPYARSFLRIPAQLMSGAEIHANIVEMLLSGERVQTVAWWQNAIFAALLGAILALGFFRRQWWWQLSALVGVLALSLIAAKLLFAQLWILPVAAAQATLVVMAMGIYAYRVLIADRQRAHMRSLFGRYVPNQVVDELLLRGQKPGVDGEQVPVTIIFADMWKSSTIAEGMPAKDVVAMLNSFFAEAAKAVDANGGIIAKFTGDGFMAIFGAPVLRPDHAARALAAAVDIRAAAERIAARYQPVLSGRSLPPFRIGQGIHSGECLMGSIGSLERSEYTAIGDAANVAARIEALTREFDCDIVVSRECWTAAGTYPHGGVREGQVGNWVSLVVKGRARPVEVAPILFDNAQ